MQEHVKTFKKIEIGRGDDYKTNCLLECYFFKTYYKMIAINLGKEQAFGNINNQ